MATRHLTTGAPRAIEAFHLAFLAVLPLRLDVGAYVLKGGANLRYFYGSPRFSEDIDLDVRAPKQVLESGVDRAIASPALRSILRTQGLNLVGVTKPKQTQTTQRWKIMLASVRETRDQPIRTEVEFSRRGLDERYELSQVQPEVVEPYGLRAPATQHYLPPAMITLKIRALIGRSQTQARDVFDLDLLFQQYPQLTRDEVTPRERIDIDAAIERAIELPFDAYESQVVPFLAPEFVEMLGNAAAWAQMQEHVVDVLNRLG